MTVGRSATGTVWNIQILRFVAAAMVLFGHLNHEVLQRPDLNVAGFRPFEAVWWPGGVDIFFVISGFIMYHISADQFGRPGASRRFMERRLIRLVPPYWAFTALVLVAMALFPAQLASNVTSPWHIAASFLFIPAANPSGVVFPVLILGWTLNFEMLFYVCFAIGLTMPRRIGLAIIAAILVTLALSGLFGPLDLPFGFWCSPVVIEFLFGIAIAAVRRRGVRISRGVSWLLVAAGVAALLGLRAMDVPGVDFRWRFLWAGAPALLLCAGLALVREAPEPGRIKRLLVFGGDMSFALYLSHPFTLTLLAMLMTRGGIRDPWLYIAISFVVCLIAAGLVYVGLERPGYRWLTRFYHRPRNSTTRQGAT
ncbi:MAG TPA: acyltransferase [Sphingomonas sp.]|jgi:peptidoglycan/LPS O-acetylase OafA/YrhL|uniref:acyltransferase family protein n=1 Tax=Sphingomonas sp. TaxID=28214 RepID=UPI002ED7B5DA